MVYCILGLVGAFLAVILTRTLLFTPKAQPVETCDPVEFDRDSAVRNLAELIKCKTISYNDPAMEDDGEFEKLIALLPELYPNVFSVCSFDRLPDRALLFRCRAKITVILLL